MIESPPVGAYPKSSEITEYTQAYSRRLVIRKGYDILELVRGLH